MGAKRNFNLENVIFSNNSAYGGPSIASLGFIPDIGLNVTFSDNDPTMDPIIMMPYGIRFNFTKLLLNSTINITDFEQPDE